MRGSQVRNPALPRSSAIYARPLSTFQGRSRLLNPCSAISKTLGRYACRRFKPRWLSLALEPLVPLLDCEAALVRVAAEEALAALAKEYGPNIILGE